MNCQGDHNKQSYEAKIDDSTPQSGPFSVQPRTIIVKEALKHYLGWMIQLKWW